MRRVGAGGQTFVRTAGTKFFQVHSTLISGSMNMMMKLVDTIPLNGVLVVVSRVSDPNIVRQESQKRWKSRREQIWTSDDEKLK